VISCTPNPCQNNGFCEVDSFGRAVCNCSVNWIGQDCNISSNDTLSLINEILDQLNSLNSTSVISYDMLGNIEVLRGLIQSNSSLLTSDLTNSINDFINNQINLEYSSNSTTDPELLKLLDLGIFVSK